MTDDPRFEVDNPEMQAALRRLGGIINEILNSEAVPAGRLGFALMIFAFEGPEFFWISNADRGDMFKAMREFMQREGAN